MDSSLEKINQKVREIAAVAENFPGVVIIHNLKDTSLVYMCSKGLKALGVTLENIQGLKYTEYHDRFFNTSEAKNYVPKVTAWLKRNNPGEVVSFFQQVRFSNSGNWAWYMSSVKILMQDEDSKEPLLSITVAQPIDPNNQMLGKVSRVIEENVFLQKNTHLFNKLGKREKEILRLLVLGKTSQEIAAEMFISEHTADTHRRNIKKKLGVNNLFEMSEYARAFDLI